jgi:Domain of unknown function (DUF6970)
MKKLLLLTIVVVPLYGCTGTTTQNSNPDWVNRMIADFQSKPVGNPPHSIYSYEYKGDVVYYVPPQCCDQYSVLYDSKGNVLCAPDGGLTGRGDGRCPDFQQSAKNKQLIWRDNR